MTAHAKKDGSLTNIDPNFNTLQDLSKDFIGEYAIGVGNVISSAETIETGYDINLTTFTLNNVIRTMIDFHLLQHGIEALEHFHKNVQFIDLEKEYKFLLKNKKLTDEELRYINEKLLELK